MKVLIIFFSQTGNTETVARAIDRGIRNTGNVCELARVSKVRPEKLGQYDLIGLGTPTFFYQEPLNVRRFLQGLEEPGAGHWFLFCTHGSLIGNTLPNLAGALAQKGATVIGTFDCYGSSSLQFYPRPMHTDGHPDAIALEQAEAFGASICDRSRRVRRGETGLVPRLEPVTDTWWAKQAQALTPELLRAVSPPLRFDPEACTGCLVCQDECPTDAIDIEADPPQIQKEGCIYCWYCEKICPAEAIQADWTEFARNTRGNLAKYVEALQQAEAEGRFRPYLDYRRIV
jgi:flavodoxin/ferredoxin